MKVCWNLTKNCNKNCKFCFRDKKSDDLDYNKCLVVLKNLASLDVTKINFAGGEPILFEKLPELLNESKKKGIYNKLTTNASLLNKENISVTLKNVDTLAISVDSPFDEDNYFLGRGSNQYTHIKEIIPLIIKKFPNIKVEINTVITSQTINTLNDLYNCIINDFDNKIYRWKLIRFCPFREIDAVTASKFEISDEEFQKVYKYFNNIDSSMLISVLDNEDMSKKNIVSPNGILVINQDNRSKYIDLKNNIVSLDGKKFKNDVDDNYMQNINLNLFKIFYEVAKCGSLSSTSKKIIISQPAISKSIKQLEETLDETLFYRNVNGMQLTTKGKALLSYVEEANNVIRTGIRSMIESDILCRGELKVGAPSHIASFYLYDKIKQFHDDYPQIEISIISRSTIDLIKMLENHDLDLVIDAFPIENNEKILQIEDLGKYGHSFIGLKKHNYNEMIKSIKDLEDYPLILPVSHSFHRKMLNNIIHNCNVSFKNIISIETSEMIKELILQDVGIGYILEDVAKREIAEGVLEEINISENLPTIDLKLVYIEKYLTNIPKTFIDNYLK